MTRDPLQKAVVSRCNVGSSSGLRLFHNKLVLYHTWQLDDAKNKFFEQEVSSFECISFSSDFSHHDLAELNGTS